MPRSTTLRTATLLLGLMASPAFAAPSLLVSDSGNLFANGSAVSTISYAPTGLSLNVRAGQFNLAAKNVVTGVSSFIQAFCTDIFHSLALPTTYQVGALADTLLNSVKVGQINALLAHAPVSGNAASAGLQLAIWEVQNEKGTSGYNLATGDFSVSNTDTSVLTTASSYLAKVGSGEWQADSHATVRQLRADGRQSLSYLDVPQDVPEPASLALLGAGLVGLGLIRRRSKQVEQPQAA